jgi:hypothetical protein
MIRDVFSHKEYLKPCKSPARMKVYYALRDAFGLQDVIQDSIATWNGEKFHYREYEPSQGVMVDRKGLYDRILHGLRYSEGGQKKYWLPESNMGNHVSIPIFVSAQEEQQDAVLEDSEEVDYNEAKARRDRCTDDYFPIINETVPLLKGGVETTLRSMPDAASSTPSGMDVSEFQSHEERELLSNSMAGRLKEGCVDNVNGYVLGPKDKSKTGHPRHVRTTYSTVCPPKLYGTCGSVIGAPYGRSLHVV